ncbi:hypothetical protein AVEN_209779-1 [Araneus ventricosus]|uniref:Uncharacterized protein n=1 Tax=Araneus ventricosus TaxID=182803 RepID=A0A4Y2LNY3_ARAVE|nr:hypothetical protein AVEN_209779-1 [Araneus ventricosus]
MQIVLKLQPNDGPQSVAFAMEMLSRIENKHDFLNSIIFSDETTFHDSVAQFPGQKISRPPLDFFFWGYVKDKVYSREIHDVGDLRASITAAIATVTTEMLQRTWLELYYQLDILRTTKGVQVEMH